MVTQGPDDGRPSVLEQISSHLTTESESTRSTDRDCDGCNTTEGSVTVNKSAGWALCDDCLNDPDTLEDFIDG